MLLMAIWSRIRNKYGTIAHLVKNDRFRDARVNLAKHPEMNRFLPNPLTPKITGKVPT
jgi:hypothetical protein